MKTSKNGITLIKRYESFRNIPYLCSAGVPTVGWGNTSYEDGTRVELTDEPINRRRAEEVFYFFLNDFERSVNKLVTAELNQNQFDALVSFTYNLGAGNLQISTLLNKINKNKDDKDIVEQFKRWDKARVNGRLRPLKGLTKRRNEEAYLYFTKILEDG